MAQDRRESKSGGREAERGSHDEKNAHKENEGVEDEGLEGRNSEMSGGCEIGGVIECLLVNVLVVLTQQYSASSPPDHSSSVLSYQCLQCHHFPSPSWSPTMPPSRRPKPFRLILRQWLYRLRTYRTPLDLRASVFRLRRFNNWPVLALVRLMIPFPSWKFSIPDMPSSTEMLGHEKLHELRMENMIDLRSIPVWRARDTPLRSIYRMYEAMIADVYVAIGTETEYFWYQRDWGLQSIPDPLDPDPIRYAMVACLVEELVEACNWRLSLGMRRNGKHIYRDTGSDPWPPYTPIKGPSWTIAVPGLTPDILHGLPPGYVSDGKLVLETGGLSEVFARRNIVTNVGWLYTI